MLMLRLQMRCPPPLSSSPVGKDAFRLAAWSSVERSNQIAFAPVRPCCRRGWTKSECVSRPTRIRLGASQVAHGSIVHRTGQWLKKLEEMVMSLRKDSITVSQFPAAGAVGVLPASLLPQIKSISASTLVCHLPRSAADRTRTAPAVANSVTGPPPLRLSHPPPNPQRSRNAPSHLSHPATRCRRSQGAVRRSQPCLETILEAADRG